MIVEGTIEARKELAKSPSFAMSLGAKELFHTNFLGFLLESDDEELEPVRTALRDALGFRVEPGERSRCFVWREKAHLDLVLVPVAVSADPAQPDKPVRSRALVVEAKLKSIPSWEQLERYRNETLKSLRLDHGEKPNDFRISLSTDDTKRSSTKRSSTKPALLLLAPTDLTVHEAWTTVSWEAVQDKLRLVTESLPSDSTFTAILKDYADALAALLKVINATREFAVCACESGDMTYGDYEKALTRSELRRMRLHDLVGKLANDEWVRRLMCQLKPRLEKAYGAAASQKVLPYVHFSNSQPGLGLEIDASNDFRIGIQVQGGQLRRYVSSKKANDDLERHMQQKGLWTDWFMQSVGGIALTGAATKKTDALTELYCFDRKKFLYSALDLKPVKMQDAETAILDSMELALEKAADSTLWS